MLFEAKSRMNLEFRDFVKTPFSTWYGGKITVFRFLTKASLLIIDEFTVEFRLSFWIDEVWYVLAAFPSDFTEFLESAIFD
jgi:hypothetical protein